MSVLFSEMGKISYSTLKKLCSRNQSEVELAFTTIFEKYRYLVYYVSFDILKSDEDTKDIVNEAFLKMYERRATFMSESKLKYFLLVTAKNLAIDRYRELKNRLDYSDDIKGTEDKGGISLYLDKFKDIRDEEEYKYLILRLVYEFSSREIAKANGLTTSQVSSKYQRGIKKLRDYYGGEF